jgi:hypothetical protein
MNHYRVNFSSKLNNGWADFEVSAGTTAGAIAQVKALYPDATAISAPIISILRSKRQQTKAVAGRKLKKTEERSRRNDEAHAANCARCNRIPATVALGRRQTTVLSRSAVTRSADIARN